MRIVKAWIAAVLTCISTGAFAQAATFDQATGILTLPAVKVGTATFTNVTLGLINPANYTFRLQAATPQVPAGPANISFDASTGVLSIPTVQVSSTTFINVTLQLTDASTYTFILTAATVQPPASGNASVCLDPSSLATGTRWELFDQYTTNGAVTITTKTTTDVLGPQTFNGQNSTETRTAITTLTGIGAGTTAESLSYVRLENPDVLTLGNIAQSTTSGVTTNVTTAYNPPIVFRYSLSAGESVTTSYNGTQTTTITGLLFNLPPQTQTLSGSVTYTFLGFEDVTVPAGTFAGACKWSSSTTLSGTTSLSTQWYTRKGALLKTVTGAQVSELTSGTLNGGPVGP